MILLQNSIMLSTLIAALLLSFGILSVHSSLTNEPYLQSATYIPNTSPPPQLTDDPAKLDVTIEVKNFPPQAPANSYFTLEFRPSGMIFPSDVIIFQVKCRNSDCQVATPLSSDSTSIVHPFFPELLSPNKPETCMHYSDDPQYRSPSVAGTFILTDKSKYIQFTSSAVIPVNSFILCHIALPAASDNDLSSTTSPGSLAIVGGPKNKFNNYKLYQPTFFYPTDKLSTSLTWLDIEQSYAAGDIVNGQRIDTFSVTYLGLPPRSVIYVEFALDIVSQDRLDKISWFQSYLYELMGQYWDLVDGMSQVRCGKDVRLFLEQDPGVTRLYILTGANPDQKATCSFIFPIFQVMQHVSKLSSFDIDEWQGSNIAVYTRLNNRDGGAARIYLHETTRGSDVWDFNTDFTFQNIFAVPSASRIDGENRRRLAAGGDGDGVAAEVYRVITTSFIVPTRTPTVKFGSLFWVKSKDKAGFIKDLFDSTRYLSQFSYNTSPVHNTDPSKQHQIKVNAESPLDTDFDLTSKPYHNITIAFKIPTDKYVPFTLEVIFTNKAGQQAIHYIGRAPQLSVPFAFAISPSTSTATLTYTFTQQRGIGLTMRRPLAVHL
jgi:hypothetical protein